LKEITFFLLLKSSILVASLTNYLQEPLPLKNVIHGETKKPVIVELRVSCIMVRVY